LVVLAIAQFMVILDITVVNVALPSIGEDLSFAPADLQWVVSAYVLLTGGLMLLGGRFADLLGRRTVFLAGLGVFTVASLLSGLAWSPTALVLARAAQGVGAAMLLPSALSIITTTYTGPQRTVALGVWGALGSAGVAVGVLLGGILTSLLSWRWIFFVNVPVGVVVALAALHVVTRSRGTRTRLDLLGGITLTAGLVTLVYAIQGTSTHGWGSARTLLLGAGAVVLLAIFFLVERHAHRPLVPPAIWRVRSLTASAIVMLGATGLLVGAFFLNTLYLQERMDASAIEAGLAFLPLALVILLAAHVASNLLPRVGTRPLMVGGLLLTAAGALLLTGVPAEASYASDLLPAFLAIGFGIGLTFVSVSVAAMSDVEHETAGLASGLMTTGHELGAALGVAVLAAVAAGAGGSAGIVNGYTDGFVVAAAIAGLLALVAAAVVPSVRPAAGQRVSMH
jgi:EmrB/QacA subfamily drug resistance transporter